MGVRLIKGRLLDDRDGPTAPRVVVVSEAFAERYLRGINPIGQRLEIPQSRQAGRRRDRRRRAGRCGTSGSIGRRAPRSWCRSRSRQPDR